MTLKAYKYRLYPTKTQVQYLNEVFGSVRFVWNQLVANFNSYSKDGPNRPMSEKILKDNPEYSWLNKISSVVLQQKRMDFDEAKNLIFRFVGSQTKDYLDKYGIKLYSENLY